MKGPKKTSAKGADYQPPVKLDYLLITTMERGPDNNFLPDMEARAKFGEKPTNIPVRLLYDDPALNMPSRLAAYKGKTLWCTGDGEVAMRVTDDGKDRRPVSCPCPLSDPAYQGSGPKCKINASLSVIIRGLGGVGGVWKLRTTSYNTVTSIASSMEYIRTITGGPLAGLPLVLSMRVKAATNPVDGAPVTIYVADLMFEGADEEALMEAGHRVALERAKNHIRIETIESEARRVLALPPPVNAPLPGDDSPEDITAEFYHAETIDQEPTGAAAAIAALTAKPEPAPPPAAHDTDGIVYDNIVIPRADVTPENWTKAICARIREATSPGEVSVIMAANAKTLEALGTSYPTQRGYVTAAMNEMTGALADGPAQAAGTPSDDGSLF